MKTALVSFLLLFFAFGCSRAKPKTVIGTYIGDIRIKTETEIYSLSEGEEPQVTSADTSYTWETEITLENDILHYLGYQIDIRTLEYEREYYKVTDEETAIATLVLYENALSYKYEYHDCSELSHSTQTVTYFGFKND